jgi:hypothetical protein
MLGLGCEKATGMVEFATSIELDEFERTPHRSRARRQRAHSSTFDNPADPRANAAARGVTGACPP